MGLLKDLQRKTFPTLIALTALSVSASAAFYSVTGLSKLFAGASFQVMIMAGSLEVAKLVIASLLYQYWGQLNKILRTYLTIATVILVLITSAGIYGFLSAAYQETATKSGIVDKEVQLLELKKSRFVENRDYLLSEKSQLDQSITSLREGLANNVIQYKDKETGQIITTTSSSNRRALQSQLESAVTQRDVVSKRLEVATDSISSIEVKMLDVESNSELAGELGPLKYLSELTGTPMNKIINILLLVIIFVFDPLAISLVVASNFAFDKIAKPKKEEEQEEVNNDVTVGPQPMKLNDEVLNQLERLLNKKIEQNHDIIEPDSEQEVLVDEEEIDEEELIDEEFYQWEKESAEELHLRDIEKDFEPEIIFSKDQPQDGMVVFNSDEIFEEQPSITKEEQRKLIEELMRMDQENGLYEDFEVTLYDGLEDEEWDEDHSLDQVLNQMIEDLEEDGENFEELVKHPEVKLEELKNIEVEEEVVETETDETTIFEEEDEDLGDDTTYGEPEEVDPPKDPVFKSPFLRVGNRIIPRNNR